MASAATYKVLDTWCIEPSHPSDNGPNSVDCRNANFSLSLVMKSECSPFRLTFLEKFELMLTLNLYLAPLPVFFSLASVYVPLTRPTARG